MLEFQILREALKKEIIQLKSFLVLRFIILGIGAKTNVGYGQFEQ